MDCIMVCIENKQEYYAHSGKNVVGAMWVIYDICIYNPPNNYSKELYEYALDSLIYLIEKYSSGLNYYDKKLKYFKYIYYQSISITYNKTYNFLDKMYAKRTGLLPLKDSLEKKFMDHYAITKEELDSLEEQMIKEYKIKQVLAVLQLPIDDNDILRLICERVLKFEVDKKEMLKIHGIDIKYGQDNRNYSSYSSYYDYPCQSNNIKILSDGRLIK